MTDLPSAHSSGPYRYYTMKGGVAIFCGPVQCSQFRYPHSFVVQLT